jgi:hypothetical protein
MAGELAPGPYCLGAPIRTKEQFPCWRAASLERLGSLETVTGSYAASPAKETSILVQNLCFAGTAGSPHLSQFKPRPLRSLAGLTRERGCCLGTIGVGTAQRELMGNRCTGTGPNRDVRPLKLATARDRSDGMRLGPGGGSWLITQRRNWPCGLPPRSELLSRWLSTPRPPRSTHCWRTSESPACRIVRPSSRSHGPAIS